MSEYIMFSKLEPFFSNLYDYYFDLLDTLIQAKNFEVKNIYRKLHFFYYRYYSYLEDENINSLFKIIKEKIEVLEVKHKWIINFSGKYSKIDFSKFKISSIVYYDFFEVSLKIFEGINTKLEENELLPNNSKRQTKKIGFKTYTNFFIKLQQKINEIIMTTIENEDMKTFTILRIDMSLLSCFSVYISKDTFFELKKQMDIKEVLSEKNLKLIYDRNTKNPYEKQTFKIEIKDKLEDLFLKILKSISYSFTEKNIDPKVIKPEEDFYGI